MAIDLTGIHNDNEFYTNHYLHEILEKDLKDVLKEWRRAKQEEDITPPWNAVGKLRKRYFELRSGLEREREPEVRIERQRPFLRRLLGALGYDVSPSFQPLENGGALPLIGEVTRSSGAPELWILEVVDVEGEETDPLELPLLPAQLPEDAAERGLSTPDAPLTEVITRHVFGRREPPRWVLVVSDAQLVLLDRTKWHEKRLLRFDLVEILGRRERSTLEAMAVLVHRESTCPSDGNALLDTLDESSHKHAFAVSEDLKYALREAIEELGNEAVWYLRERRRKGVFSGEEKLDPDQLSVECLRYMYRLLFLFYIEARPELGYAPMKAAAYREGYSLESLRDLEMVRLETEESREGYFLHESLDLLFDLIYNGWPPNGDGEQLALDGGPEHGTFRISPLKSHLFDPERTPILSRVRFRNKVLQRVIRLMSLSDPSKRKGRRGGRRRGRISYAQLGINQLGAVYEALLSYRGFFAHEDLYEVKPKKEKSHDDLDQAYFVTEDELPDYEEAERVYNDDGTLRKHGRGRFIYRLAGRDREKSASYYTPEVLTRTLVKYALKELIGDDETGMPADQILELTVCEPAMGSAAFLNEAVNQLADAYLRRKQAERGETLSPDEYAYEKQRVKMLLADNNVYGVDLNPIARELAEVSLWLNTIHEGGFVPWFGGQLVTGNSLIGARRQVYVAKLLEKRGRGEPTWLDEVPARVPLGEERPPETVYHFLLPDEGMAAYKDKAVEKMAEEELHTIREWKREFEKPWSDPEIRTLQRLSGAIDQLWEAHVRELERIRKRTTDPMGVYGKPADDPRPPTTTRYKDRILHQELHSEEVRNSSPYRRLKLVMDYWCALWFWPMEKADLLPSRDEYLLELELLLTGEVLEVGLDNEQIQLFPDTMPKQLAMELKDELGFVDVDRMCEKRPRMAVVRKLAERYRFLHWELEFADLFAARGGFDLVLGNPPWILVSWDEGGLMGDVDPRYAIRKHRASELARLRDKIVQSHDLRSQYLAGFEEAEATQLFLNAPQNYPLLQGMKANLYKCFLPQGWTVGREEGVSAFLHPEGVYDDPRGAAFREALYPRLRCHFQFQNQKKLFAEIDNQVIYSLNIHSSKRRDGVQFDHISNLFSPSTIDACFKSDERGPVPGIKDDENDWNVNGHPDRIVPVGDDALQLFATLYDEEGTPPLRARLPAVHSKQVVRVLRRFADHPKRLGDLDGQYFTTQHWNETNAQKDGTIQYTNHFPESSKDWVVSGPHFFVGTPLYKTPRDPCTSNKAYDVIDLTAIPDDYLPRTLYTPACSREEYERDTPKVPWGERKPVTRFYRFANREMVPPSGERTFTNAILPKEIGHVHTVLSSVFRSASRMLDFGSISHSIVQDFRVKTTGSGHANKSMIDNLPLVEVDSDVRSPLHLRTLLLNCLTTHYAELWEECWDASYRQERWTKEDPRLDPDTFSHLTPEWQRHCSLRTDFERRQALVELDVLSAMALGLALEELQTIFRVQFPVLRKYDRNTYYDQNGRIVYTKSRGLIGVGFKSRGWKKVKDKKQGTVERTIEDDTQPGGPVERTIVYEAPFTGVDREADYAEAWAAFESRVGEQERELVGHT